LQVLPFNAHAAVGRSGTTPSHDSWMDLDSDGEGRDGTSHDLPAICVLSDSLLSQTQNRREHLPITTTVDARTIDTLDLAPIPRIHIDRDRRLGSHGTGKSENTCMSFASSFFAPPGSSSGPGQQSGSPRECSEVPLVDDCARRFGEKRCGDAHKWSSMHCSRFRPSFGMTQMRTMLSVPCLLWGCCSRLVARQYTIFYSYYVMNPP
jgi:hypothetical protein